MLKQRSAFLLTSRHAEILRAMYFYRYMGALDVAYRIAGPGALTRIRKRLSELSGGEDFLPRQYLYRFHLPGPGNAERVYTLGARGRDFLARELGLPVFWYYRPDKVKHFSHAHVEHSLILTRVLVACHWWARQQQGFRLAGVRISYELAEKPPLVRVQGTGGKSTLFKVIPDAWLLFERSDGKRAAVLLEIDRGREYQDAFKAHVRSRIEFVAGGEYSRVFGTKGVTIAYGTTGERPEYRETRRRAMCRWTSEVLSELGRSSWADVFRITSLKLDDVYQTPLFDGEMWFRPDGKSAVKLLAG